MKMYHLGFNILTASVPFLTILGSKPETGYGRESRARSEAGHSENARWLPGEAWGASGGTPGGN